MAWVLNISDDNGSVNLNGTVLNTTGSITLLNYTPMIAPASEDSVVDVMRLEFEGTSAGVLGTLVQAVNNRLRYAAEYQERRAGSRVYLNYQPDGYVEAYRSEIVGMDADISRLELEDPYIRNWQYNTRLFANLYVTRRNFWEGTLTQIALTNPNGTANTAGLVVANGNAGGTFAAGGGTIYRNNYTQIAATSVAGDLPAPIYMEWAVGTASTVEKMYLQNFKTASQTLPFWREPLYIHNLAYPDGGSEIAEASRSGGTVFGVNIGTSTYTKMVMIENLQMDKWEFNLSHITLAANFAGTIYVKPFYVNGIANYTYMPMNIYIHRGTADYENLDLGVIRVPPINHGGTLGHSAAIGFAIKAAAAGTVKFDYGMVVPSSSYFTVTTPYLAPTSGTLYVDGYNQIVYNNITGTSIYSYQVGLGELNVYPGVAQTVVYKWENEDFNDTLNMYGTAKLYYRPRRLVL